MSQMPAAPAVVRFGEYEATVTSPDKLIWPEMNITKLDYITHISKLAPYLLPQTKQRLLTTIRYPEGINGKSFYQKNAPKPTPAFVRTELVGETNYVMADKAETLLWLASLYCLEWHVSCEIMDDPLPDRWIWDIDPTLEAEPRIMEATAIAGELLHSLGLDAVPKTSGATGVQIVMPIERGPTYEQLRAFGKFVSEYLAARHPELFTVERFKKDRGTLIYLDYLQFFPGRTLIAPYSPRARAGAPVSTPLTWDEVRRNPAAADFNLLNIEQRLQSKGDLIALLKPQPLGRVIAEIGKKSQGKALDR